MSAPDASIAPSPSADIPLTSGEADQDAGQAAVALAPNFSRSAARTMDMLDLFLTTSERLTLTEIAQRLGVPKSTAHGILQTMRARGYLSWEPQSKTYSVGLRLVSLAQAVPIFRTLRTRARPHLEHLVEAVQESALLLAYEGNSVVCLDTVDSPRPIRYSATVGERWPLHSTSAGKLFLARLSDEEAREVLNGDALARPTDGTPVDIDEVIEAVGRARRDGVVVNREEVVAGVTGCGAPIVASGDRLVATLSVVGPTERVEPNTAQIIEAVVAAAASLSSELTGESPGS